MKLYLVQHGQANPVEIDPEKGLSQKGRDDVKKVALFLEKAGVVVEQIYHSGKARAEQTAHILARAVHPKKEAFKLPGIEPMDPVEPFLLDLDSAEEDMMLVGHLPYMSRLTSKLVGSGDHEAVEFQQGGVVCLENVEESWKIRWMVIPDIVRGLGF